MKKIALLLLLGIIFAASAEDNGKKAFTVFVLDSLTERPLTGVQITLRDDYYDYTFAGVSNRWGQAAFFPRAGKYKLTLEYMLTGEKIIEDVEIKGEKASSLKVKLFFNQRRQTKGVMLSESAKHEKNLNDISYFFEEESRRNSRPKMETISREEARKYSEEELKRESDALMAVLKTKEGMGGIGGIVYDSDNKPATGATVIIVGKSKGTMAKSFGLYGLPNLEPGEYKLRYSYIGCKDTVVDIAVKKDSVEWKEIKLTEDAVHLDKAAIEEDGTLSRRHVLGSTADFSGGEGMGLAAKSDIRAVSVSEPGGGADPLMPSKRSSDGGGETSAIRDYDSEEYETGGFVENSGSAGVLTSGEVNDFRKWDMWNDFAENELKEFAKMWEIKPEKRFTLQVVNKAQGAVVDANVDLIVSKRILWSAKTDNTGKAELWAEILDNDNIDTDNLMLRVTYRGKTTDLKDITEFKEGINIIQLNEACETPKNVDIMFAVDATGSMGDEINYLKAEVTDIIGKIEEKFPRVRFRTGSVFYRDTRDQYLIRRQDLTDDIRATSHFISQQQAQGGGDYPEAVETALEVITNEINWSGNAIARICFLILDAPPHNNPIVREKIRELSAAAALQGIRIVPVTCSGVDKKTEYLMRSIALLTNGTYAFLTDDSGVGGSHIKPTTDKYDVELLNDLFIRLIGQFTTVPECGDNDFYVREDADDNVFNKDEDKFDTGSGDWKRPLKCYPNPTRGELSIEILYDLDQIFVVDVAGKILWQFSAPYKGSEVIDLTRYPTGIYFIKYSKDGKWGVEKVILVR